MWQYGHMEPKILQVADLVWRLHLCVSGNIIYHCQFPEVQLQYSEELKVKDVEMYFRSVRSHYYGWLFNAASEVFHYFMERLKKDYNQIVETVLKDERLWEEVSQAIDLSINGLFGRVMVTTPEDVYVLKPYGNYVYVANKEDVIGKIVNGKGQRRLLLIPKDNPLKITELPWFPPPDE